MSENPSTHEIEEDLSRTRTRLGGHLTELRSRTTPGQVLDELMVYFRGKEGAEFGRNLMDGVRSNPLPAAITGIGLTWLMASNPASRRVDRSPADSGTNPDRVERGGWDKVAAGYGRTPHDRGVNTVKPEPVREPYETETAFSARLDIARAKSLGIERDPHENDDAFRQRIQDGLASVKQSAVEVSHNMRDKVGNLAGSVSSTAQRSGQSLSHGGQAAGAMGGNLVSTLVESPVLLGALGLAAGALLGALLPQSDQEGEALSGIAAQARDTATGLAQEAVDRGGAVAQSVVDTGHDSADAHGLTGGRSPGAFVDAALDGSLAADARQVAKDVLQTGDKAVREQTGKA